MDKRLAFFLVAFLMISCEKNEESVKAIFFNVNQSEKVKLSDQFELVGTIALEMDPEALLGNVQLVQSDGGHFYVLTEGKTNGIYKFDLNGKFIGQIGRKGNGPGEFGYIQNFFLRDDKIVILDSELRKTMVYKKAGGYIKNYKEKLFALDVVPYANNGQIYYCGNSFNGNLKKKLIHVGSDGEVVHTAQKVSVKQADFLNIVPQKAFTRYGSYLEPFGKVVYTLTEEIPVPAFAIDFGDYSVPKEDLYKPYDNIAVFLAEMRKKNYAMLFSEFFETSTHLSFSFEHGSTGRRHHLFLNKSDSSYHIFETYEEDLFLSKNIQLKASDFKIVGSDDQHFIFCAYPYTFLNRPGDSIKGIKFNDNPILYVLRKKS